MFLPFPYFNIYFRLFHYTLCFPHPVVSTPRDPGTPAPRFPPSHAKAGLLPRLCPAFARKKPFDVIFDLFKMKQFHWLLCVAKNSNYNIARALVLCKSY